MSHANTSCFLIHPPLPACCQHILSPRSCSCYTTICMVSHSSLPPFLCGSSCGLSNPLLHASVCNAKLVYIQKLWSVPFPQFTFTGYSSKALTMVCMLRHFFSLACLCQVITYFTYFKMLVCIRMDLKFKVEFYLWIFDGLEKNHSFRASCGGAHPKSQHLGAWGRRIMDLKPAWVL